MILSIDPGVNNCGVAVVDYSTCFKVAEVFNVTNARKFTQEEKLVEAKFGARVVKVNNILSQVEGCLLRHPRVNHVTIEAPFYNALTPLAYGSLLEVISAIKYRLLLPMGLAFSMTEPLVVKKVFLSVKINKGTTAKEVMRRFMEQKVKDKIIVVGKPVQEMTEHEIDAIAIAFVKVASILEEKQNA